MKQTNFDLLKFQLFLPERAWGITTIPFFLFPTIPMRFRFNAPRHGTNFSGFLRHGPYSCDPGEQCKRCGWGKVEA